MNAAQLRQMQMELAFERLEEQDEPDADDITGSMEAAMVAKLLV